MYTYSFSCSVYSALNNWGRYQILYSNVIIYSKTSGFLGNIHVESRTFLSVPSIRLQSLSASNPMREGRVLL